MSAEPLKRCQHSDPSLGCHKPDHGNATCGAPAELFTDIGCGFCKPCAHAILNTRPPRFSLKETEALELLLEGVDAYVVVHGDYYRKAAATVRAMMEGK